MCGSRHSYYVWNVLGGISLVFGWGGGCRTSTLKFKGGALITFYDMTINNFYGGKISWRETFGHFVFCKKK